MMRNRYISPVVIRGCSNTYVDTPLNKQAAGVEAGTAKMAMRGCHTLNNAALSIEPCSSTMVPIMIPFQQVSAGEDNVKAEATEMDFGWLNN